MNYLIDSVIKSLQNKNWYAALTLTLTLPDICGKIEYPKIISSKRYSKWFDKYVKSKYTKEVGPAHKIRIFLNGKDCYALRCSYLNQGTSPIFFQKVRDVLDDFQFVVPPEGFLLHCNQVNKILQLQVEDFCTDIVDSVETWLHDIKDDQVKMGKINKLLKITIITPWVPDKKES
jgi:hypothetical protein